MNQDYTEFEERLFQVSWQLLVENGIRTFTVENVAYQLGASKKTIYKSIASRDDLLRKAIEYHMAVFDRKLNDIISTAINPLEKFLAVINFVSSFLSKIQTQRMFELKMRYPDLWKLLEKFRFERRKQFRVILLEAQQAGYISDAIDIDFFVLLLMQMIHGTFQPEFLFENQLDKSKTVLFFFRMISEGILTEEGKQYVKTI